MLLFYYIVHTSTENLLWCCIWSCRRCGWACPDHTGSTRPCHWLWSSRGTHSSTYRGSLRQRDKKCIKNNTNLTVCIFESGPPQWGRSAHKFHSHRRNHTRRSGSRRVGMCLVGWSQPWSGWKCFSVGWKKGFVTDVCSYRRSWAQRWRAIRPIILVYLPQQR